MLDELEVEVGRTSEDRGEAGLTGDDREQPHLDAVDSVPARLFARMLASSSEESDVRDPWDTAMWKMPATVVSGRRDVVERRMRRGGHERCRRRKSSVARLKVSASS